MEKGEPMKTLNCAKHPNGLIEHSYDLTQPVLNGIPSGEGWKSNHKYRCHDCGVELISLAEAEELAKSERVRTRCEMDRTVG